MYEFEIQKSFPRSQLKMSFDQAPNKEKIGDVYFLAYHSNCGQFPYARDLLNHTMVVVDVLGASDDETIKGMAYHLGVDIATWSHCYPLPTISWTCPTNQPNWKYIGNPFLTYRESQYIHDLINFLNIAAQETYDLMKLENKGTDEWSSVLNCQNFSKSFVLKLGLPYEGSTGSELAPLLVDFAIFSKRTTTTI